MKAYLKVADREEVSLIEADFAACPAVGESIFTTGSPVPEPWKGHFMVTRVTWRYSEDEQEFVPTFTLARRTD